MSLPDARAPQARGGMALRATRLTCNRCVKLEYVMNVVVKALRWHGSRQGRGALGAGRRQGRAHLMMYAGMRSLTSEPNASSTSASVLCHAPDVSGSPYAMRGTKQGPQVRVWLATTCRTAG